MSDVFTIAQCVPVARPYAWFPLASLSEMNADHAMNGTPTGTTGSKRLTPGHLIGVLT